MQTSLTHPETTREQQYQFLLELERREGLSRLGLMSSHVWRDDPRHLCFLLARYKFVSKLFSGLDKVLEVGCADAFGTRLVRQTVNAVVASDFDPVFIRRNQERQDPGDKQWPLAFRCHDMTTGPLSEGFDAVYAVDVIEHIPAEKERLFVGNMVQSLNPNGMALLGSPSLHSQAYASPGSKAGHINCKDEQGMRSLMGQFFHNVFIFSMNDEVIHTGFTPMAHYLWALGCHRRH
jgi:2-polyprenyl-3-methyl-5-hydroxy-6-metoxy-1,4-benzoquinol methylase